MGSIHITFELFSSVCSIVYPVTIQPGSKYSLERMFTDTVNNKYEIVSVKCKTFAVYKYKLYVSIHTLIFDLLLIVSTDILRTD